MHGLRRNALLFVKETGRGKTKKLFIKLLNSRAAIRDLRNDSESLSVKTGVLVAGNHWRCCESSFSRDIVVVAMVFPLKKINAIVNVFRYKFTGWKGVKLGFGLAKLCFVIAQVYGYADERQQPVP